MQFPFEKQNSPPEHDDHSEPSFQFSQYLEGKAAEHIQHYNSDHTKGFKCTMVHPL